MMPQTRTAEWICTRCGSTNRKLVASETIRAEDSCVTCGAKHLIEADDRPVRWQAKAK